MNKAPKDVMIELHDKFAHNFNEWKSVEDVRFENTFVYLQCVAATGDILRIIGCPDLFLLELDTELNI
jgi:hypothetical protein